MRTFKLDSDEWKLDTDPTIKEGTFWETKRRLDKVHGAEIGQEGPKTKLAYQGEFLTPDEFIHVCDTANRKMKNYKSRA